MPQQNTDFLTQSWEWMTNIMTIETFIKLAVLYFFVIWISIIVWVMRDITNRTDSIIIQFFALFIVLVGTPFGVFIYLLIRPTKTLFESYYEEVEQNLDLLANTIKDKLGDKEDNNCTCPKCNYPIDTAYKFCPNCKEELKYECRKCEKKIDKSWKVCAHCGVKNPYEGKSKNKKSKKK